MRSSVYLASAVLLGFCSSAGAYPDPESAVVQAHLAVKSLRLVDNGDNDGFADPNESVQIYVTLRNGSGSDRQGIVIRMASTDATVGCIPTPIVSFGSLAAGEVREGTVPPASWSPPPEPPQPRGRRSRGCIGAPQPSP